MKFLPTIKKLPLLGMLTLAFFSINASAQNKIVLKDQSYIKDAEYRNINNNVIEYLQNGSLHDIEADKVLWVEQANGSRLYFDDKGISYSKKEPVVAVSQKTVVVPETDKNKVYFDSIALDNEKRELRKAAYEKELERRYKQSYQGNPSSVAYDSVVTSGKPYYNPAKVNFSFRQGIKDGKIYRSKTSGRNLPYPLVINKLPISEEYADNDDYKQGFMHGIEKKSQQRTNVAIIVIGSLVASTLFIAYTVHTTGLYF